MANSKTQERNLAQALYLTGLYTQKQIAEMVNVAEKTICIWVEGGHWEKMRAAKLSTTDQAVSNMIAIQNARSAQILEAINGGSTDKYGDEMLKMAKAIQELQGSISLSTYIEVLQDFMGFIGNKDHKFRGQLASYQSEYLNKKAGTNNG